MTNHKNNAASRPDPIARAVGYSRRRRFTTRLSKGAGRFLGEAAYSRAKRAAQKTYGDWAVIRIRPDTMAALRLLQEAHLTATSKEIAKSELISLLTLVGMPAVLQHNDFEELAEDA